MAVFLKTVFFWGGGSRSRAELRKAEDYARIFAKCNNTKKQGEENGTSRHARSLTRSRAVLALMSFFDD